MPGFGLLESMKSAINYDLPGRPTGGPTKESFLMDELKFGPLTARQKTTQLEGKVRAIVSTTSQDSIHRIIDELIEVQTTIESSFVGITPEVYDKNQDDARKLLERIKIAVDECQKRVTAVQPQQPKSEPVTNEKGMALPEIIKEGRNALEEYLLASGFSKEQARDTTEAGLERKRAFILTKSLTYVVEKIDWPDPIVSNPSSYEFYSSPRFGKFNASQLARSSIDFIEDPEEKKRIESGLRKPLEIDLGIIGQFFDAFKEVKKSVGDVRAQQSLESMSKFYGGDITKNLFDKDRVDWWGKFPKLVESGTDLTNISLGDAFFLAFKEILRTGKVWDPPIGSVWPRPKKSTFPADVYDKQGKNLAIFSVNANGERQIIQIPEEYVSDEDEGVIKNKSLFPEFNAGGQSNIKPDTMKRLRVAISEAAKRANSAEAAAYMDSVKDKGYQDFNLDAETTLIGNVAMLLAYHLAVLCGEADFQDNVKNRPVGQNVMPRIAHASSYAKKTNKPGSSESKTNLYIVGRALSFVRPFTKFVRVDGGMTLEQAVVSAKSWLEITGDKIKTWPAQMTDKWRDQMVQGFGEYKRAENGLTAKFFQIAEVDLKEGRVKINDKIVSEIHDAIRYSWEYHVKRDMSPDAIMTNWGVEGKNFELEESNPDYRKRRLPSDEFVEIRVVDHNDVLIRKTKIDNDGRPVKDEKTGAEVTEVAGSFVTKMPRYYLVTPVRLASWIQCDSIDGKAYESAVVDQWDIQDDAGRPTGQKGTRIKIKLKKEDVLVEKKYKGSRGKKDEIVQINTAELISKRLMVEYVFEMLAMPGDVMARLDKKDYLAFGLFLSREVREKFLKGHYGKISDLVKGGFAEFLEHNLGMGSVAEFLNREDPGLVGDDIFSEKQYFEFLWRMGHRLTMEDFKTVTEVASSLVLGEAPATKGGKK